MKGLQIAAILAVLGAPAMAERANGGYVGCITEDALDEFITAAVNDDNRQMQALLGVSCMPIGGLEYSMVDRGFMTSEIRVYTGQGSVRLFTPSEAVR
ncbi:hypothetical protein ACFSUD_18040 [Sulfitobacter aestuarii]|uniref:Uncharacterized protein n=1 Tax=Sulfitobacter aestuarii TaxID=2161676 RepID=A0ABW5U9Q9_9RHOB